MCNQVWELCFRHFLFHQSQNLPLFWHSHSRPLFPLTYLTKLICVWIHESLTILFFLQDPKGHVYHEQKYEKLQEKGRTI